jgi:hypothetical protein
MAFISHLRRAWGGLRKPRGATAGLAAPWQAPPPLLIHFHIFKNAGSSLDAMLAESFGAAFTPYDNPAPFPDVDPDGLRGFLADRPRPVALSSHLPRRFLLGEACLPIVMLRHPIDRARSVYQFLKRDLTAKDNPVAVQGFPAYVLWGLDVPGEGVSIRNYQTFHLSGSQLEAGDDLLISTRDDLRQALELLRAWPCFGLVREFAKSCEMFQARYAPLYPGLRLYDRRDNASPEGAGTEAAAIEATRAELGPALYARLLEANELDLELYRAAEALFRARVRGQP